MGRFLKVIDPRMKNLTSILARLSVLGSPSTKKAFFYLFMTYILGLSLDVAEKYLKGDRKAEQEVEEKLEELERTGFYNPQSEKFWSEVNKNTPGVFSFPDIKWLITAGGALAAVHFVYQMRFGSKELKKLAETLEKTEDN